MPGIFFVSFNQDFHECLVQPFQFSVIVHCKLIFVGQILDISEEIVIFACFGNHIVELPYRGICIAVDASLVSNLMYLLSEEDIMVKFQTKSVVIAR